MAFEKLLVIQLVHLCSCLLCDTEGLCIGIRIKAPTVCLGSQHVGSKTRYWTHADRAFSTLWKQFPCTPDGSLAPEQLVYHIPEISADGPP